MKVKYGVLPALEVKMIFDDFLHVKLKGGIRFPNRRSSAHTNPFPDR